MTKDSKIFITGATGLLGSEIVKQLFREGYHEIYATKRKTSRLDLLSEYKDRIEWLEGTINDVPFLEESMKGMDVVIHAAAVVSLHAKMRDAMTKVNVEGTANIVNMCLDYNIPRLIFVSSIASLGRDKPGVPISEKTPWQKSKYNSHYAITKYLSELEVWRGQAEGLSTAIVNPALVLGAGIWSNSSLAMFETLDKGVGFYPSGSNGVVDSRDVASFVVQLMASSIEEERFILCSKNVKLKKLVQDISKQIDAQIPNKELKGVLKFLSWRVERLRSLFTNRLPLITKETVVNTSQEWTYDNSKSKSHLEFKYRSYEETVKDCCIAFLQSKEKGLDYGSFKN